MHFYTRRPPFSDDSITAHANAAAGWTSGSTAFTVHGDFGIGGKRLASLTSITYNSFGDVRAGSILDPAYDSVFLRTHYVERVNDVDSIFINPDPLVQRFSGYTQYDILQKVAFRPGDRATHTLNFQLSNSSNIPRYDRLTDVSGGMLRFAEWYYGPQKRLMGSLMSEIISASKIFNKATVVLAAQSVSQDRINRRRGDVNRISQMEDLIVYSLNADLVKVIGSRNELRYGLDGQYNDVKSVAANTDIITGLESPAATRYPDGGSMMALFGAYVSHRFRASEKLILSEGIRFSMSHLKARFVDTTFFPFPFTEITQGHSAITGNVGLVVKPIKTWRFSVLGSSGFRSPNVDDLTKIFESSPGTLIIANPNLRPEMAYNAEVGIEKTCYNTVRISLTGWATKLMNAMVVKNFNYNGEDSVFYQGVMSQVQAVQNADDGTILGITGTFAADFNEHFSLVSTATLTRGTYHDADSDTIVPLDHIPPAFGRTALVFSDKKFTTEFYALYNGWKRVEDYSPSGEDNLQYATAYGMPSWCTFNVKAAWQATHHIRIQGGIENILDIHYRHFASGISAPGRSFNVMLRARV
jgi:hemoglobin/transferrin/lactoferrin receptor protein